MERAISEELIDRLVQAGLEEKYALLIISSANNARAKVLVEFIKNGYSQRVPTTPLILLEKKIVIKKKIDHDLAKEGFELIQDQDTPVEFDPSMIKPVNILQPGERYIEGKEWHNRAQVFSGILGQRHAEALVSLSVQLPKTWQMFDLVFSGTVWYSKQRGYRVNRMTYSEQYSRWLLVFDSFGPGWGQFTRAALYQSATPRG